MAILELLGRVKFTLVLLIVLAAAIGGGAGYHYYNDQVQAATAVAHTQLTTAAEFKVNYVNRWREAQLKDGRLILGNWMATGMMLDVLRGDQHARAGLLKWLDVRQRTNGYTAAILLDRTGRPVISAGAETAEDPDFGDLATEAIARNDVYLTEIHREYAGVRLALVVPIRDGGGRVRGALVQRIDPRQELLPFLGLEPTPYRTERTAMASAQGDEIVLLNRQSVRDGKEPWVSISKDAQLDIVQVVRGVGSGTGVDHFGVPVLFAGSRVPGSAWRLSVRVKTAEIYDPLFYRAVRLAVLIAMLVGTCITVIILLWRGQRVEFYREKYQHELERRALAGHYGCLSRYANDMIFLVTEQGAIVDANERACEVYGRTREELIRMDIGDLRTPGQRQLTAEHLESARNQEGYIFETVHRRGDGSEMPVEVSSRWLEVDGRRYLQAILRDVTERKSMERALITSERRYRLIFNGGGDAVYVYGFEEDGLPGKFIEVNNVACELLEYTREELLRMTPGDIDPRPRADGFGVFQELMREGRAVFEGTHRTKSGRQFPVEIRSHICELDGKTIAVATAHDITRRKQAEAAREGNVALLGLLHKTRDAQELCNSVAAFLQRWVGCENVGFRLREADDCPYHSTVGFPPGFVEAEKSLKVLENGETVRDADGRPARACLCGSLLGGELSPDLPGMSADGYFWTNNLSEVAVTLAAAVPNFRRRCFDEGYESIALIPLRFGDRSVGLLQMTDRRKGIFTAEVVDFLKNAAHNIATVLEQRDAESALRASEVRYRTIVETAAEGIMAGPNLFEIQFANPRMLEMLGMPSEEVIGRSLYDFLDVVDSEESIRRRQALAAGEKVRFEARMRRGDGSKAWASISGSRIVDEKGELSGFMGLFTDVTARRKAEESLRLMQTVVVNAYDAVLVTGAGSREGNGAILFANEAFLRETGYAMDEVLGKQQESFYSGNVNPDEVTKIRQALQSGTPCRAEIAMRRKDGEDVCFEISFVPGVSAEDGEQCVIAVARNITDRKRADEEKARLERQLVQAQKLESVGRLAGGVAHDFNNLLTIINGHSSLALKRLQEGDPLQHSMTEIRKAGEQAAGLTQQLLAFSRKQVIERRPLDLNQLIRVTASILERQAGDHVKLSWRMDPNLGRVLADGGQLQRVLMNLVANARDAMPNGGNLTIGTANVELAAGRPEHMGEIAPGSYVLLTVKDTGTGMAAETQKRIFEPFFTTKENGMGLGLSTAYGIVRQCGGSISVFSEPGHGTVFRIYIPRTDAPALTPDEPEQLQELSGNETILVVEDNGKVRRLTAEFLKLYGYKVLEASQGGEALLAAEQHAGPIHLMLTDVMMPRMTGLELAQRIKPLREETRVLFMSGHADNVITHWGVVDKGVEYIAKPFTPEALAARIRKVLAPPEEAGSVQ